MKESGDVAWVDMWLDWSQLKGLFQKRKKREKKKHLEKTHLLARVGKAQINGPGLLLFCFTVLICVFGAFLRSLAKMTFPFRCVSWLCKGCGGGQWSLHIAS